MRLQTRFMIIFGVLLIPALLFSKSYTEAYIDKLDGTIMVQHADGSKPTALQTGSTVQKGDTITVYDKSWVIFKTHRGEKIGLDSNTVMSVDEYYYEGPDRQVRLVLQKGSIFLNVNNINSRQSFFEINTGSLVTSVNDAQSLLSYDKAKDSYKVQYFRGLVKVIDKNDEQNFSVQHTERYWEGGVMKAEEPKPVEELDYINYKKFLSGQPRLQPTDRNILLRGSN